MRGYRTLLRISTSSIGTQLSKYQILRSISQKPWLQQRIIEVVPALGESITEGSIASWNKNVGDRVTVDEVIVIVETDKVTVDIKSTNAGILVAKLANDTVVVGAPLYELETSSEGTTAVTKMDVLVPPIHASVPLTPIHDDVKRNFRVPLIKFIGKRSLLKHAILAPHIAAPAGSQLISAQKQPLKVIKEGSGVDFSTLKRGAMYGRPALSQREMDAIESGGATY